MNKPIDWLTTVEKEKPSEQASTSGHWDFHSTAASAFVVAVAAIPGVVVANRCPLSFRGKQE
jgi:hypothetical protein